MKVYSVFWSDKYEDWGFYGVFSSQEKARQYIVGKPLPNYEHDMESYKKGFYIIEDELDEPKE